MIFLFYFFAALLVWLSFKSFRGGFTYLNYFRDELAKPRSEFTPFVSVIAPCKGLDDGLEQNLSALFEQDYPEYEVIFVIDNAADPAVGTIDVLLNRRDAETRRNEYAVGDPLDFRSSVSLRLCGNNFVSPKMVVAPKADGCAQKIANLREAVLHADKRSLAFVFVDSDARPSANWLRSLIAPLADDNVGAATGYRWFISKIPTFASEVRSVWNASIASALGPNTRSNFCWGGSTAIRRDVFERIRMREKWMGTLSDDFTVTRAMNEANLPIVFVPQALTASVESCTIREMLEFTTRQMKITRVYATKLWIMSLIGSALFNAVLIAAFLIVVLSKTNDLAVGVSLLTILLVAIFSVGKAWLRLSAVRLVLTQHETLIKRQSWTQLTLWLLSPALYLYNSLAALASRRITWRGITYELKSRDETVIISH
jgi:cellulose synthase/poly-beta-1,6-N-acetylglucosamine synthase-like glycosyltransferase